MLFALDLMLASTDQFSGQELNTEASKNGHTECGQESGSAKANVEAEMDKKFADISADVEKLTAKYESD